MDDEGYFQISDRLKDVIKSGGEWISSVELENLLVGSPDVVEAAVIGIPDEKWTERPLACVVVSQDTDPVTLAEFLDRQGRALADAGELGLHRGGAEDDGGQVRQEGAARPLPGR